MLLPPYFLNIPQISSKPSPFFVFKGGIAHAIKLCYASIITGEMVIDTLRNL